MSPCSAEKGEELRGSRASRTMLPTLEPHTWSGELQEKSKSRTISCFPAGGGFLGFSEEKKKRFLSQVERNVLSP